MADSSFALQAEITRLQQLLQRRDAVLAAMVEVAQVLAISRDPLQQAPQMLAVLGQALGVSRAYIFANGASETGQRTMVHWAEWTAPGFEPQIDNPDLRNVSYQEQGFARWEQLLAQNQVVAGRIGDFPPYEQELLAPQDILALIVAPIFVDDEWWGFLGFDDCVLARDWDPLETEALRSAAAMLGAALYNQRTHQRSMEMQQQVIDAQRDALRELSTPLIPITSTTVVMPLIGSLDSHRAQQVLETLLTGVARHQAELVILDITGVAMVDTQVAQTFIQAAQAVRLLGAQVMLTGIQPAIAQTLVQLGIDLRGIQTQGSLQAGIQFSLQRELVPERAAGARP